MKINKDSWHYRCLTENTFFDNCSRGEIDNFCKYSTRLVWRLFWALVWGVVLGVLIAGAISPSLYFTIEFGWKGFTVFGLGVWAAVTIGILLALWDKLSAKYKKPSKLYQIYDSIKNKYCIHLEFIEGENK